MIKNHSFWTGWIHLYFIWLSSRKLKALCSRARHGFGTLFDHSARKKDKMSDSAQDLSTARIEEFESDSELEKRVRLWLSQSFPPKDRRKLAGCNCIQNQDNNLGSGHHMEDVGKADPGVLYHPDFVDWASIHSIQRTPSPEKTK